MNDKRRRYWRPDMSLHGYRAIFHEHGTASTVVAAILMGSAMLLVQIAIDHTVGPLPRTLLFSDIFVGLMTALVTGVALRHHEKHIRAENARMQMVAEVNHHVRNALTAISLSVYAKNDPQLEKITRESIHRIDWALREVLESQEPLPAVKASAGETALQRSA